MWILRPFHTLLVLLLLCCTAAAEDVPEQDFFLSCSMGKMDELNTYLEAHPDWVHARTADGEYCLHLAGIYGKSAVTTMLLKLGADPNVRTSYDKGLRMHPLSWNVYGNHLENARLLLAAGADPNMDFDFEHGGEKRKVTVMDLLYVLNENNKHGDYDDLRDLLLKYGAKTLKELERGDEL
ncbi:Ankyrin repeat [Seminavis robusta]|uniref:Ankyrin repeat n=1 Tax=Seminavis robusta TaxID=568900 RepID=A0A9N8HUB8_9STRA|nr:Ankyrin repeat [Seminavis robusta]|eukprot:Sro1365_g266570.1 Ankyrin repeat (181) ;mRNA; f:19799-20341